mmetsp:Transcript_103069/g.245502  ORF Transcript_103069/g.245502 Transcript_103069/m.245502 type:complete len:213 (-) Transcript_103069:315-953(-)
MRRLTLAPAMQRLWQLLLIMRQVIRSRRAMLVSSHTPVASSHTFPASRRTVLSTRQRARPHMQLGSRHTKRRLRLQAAATLQEERIHHRHSLGTVLRPDMEQLHSTASSQHLTLPTRPLPMLQLAMGWDKVRTTTCSSLLLDPGWWLMEATRVRRARLHKHSRSLKRNCSPTPSRRQTQPSQPAAWDAGLQPRISSPNSSTWIWFGSCLTCP